MNKVSVHIVTWNSLKFLANALGSLFEQSFRDFSVLIIDNGSRDGTIEWLREYYPQIKIVQNKKNLGFAKGHNQAISFTKSDYVLAMNHDVILREFFLEKLVEFMDAHPESGSVTGKVLKLIGNPAQVDTASFTKTIDSAGLRILKSRRVVDRGEGEIDQGGFSEIEEVFGVSGSIPFYRRSALEDVAMEKEPRTKFLKAQSARYSGGDSDLPIKEVFSDNMKSQANVKKLVRGEYFDEDFYSYKEDVDLAWRLRLAGWQACFVPQAVAYHYRRAYGKDQQGNIATLKNRLKKPSFINLMSNRNHLMMLVKNEQAANFWLHFLYILWYELRKWGIVVLLEQKTLKGLWQFFKLLPKMRAKRKIIQGRAKVSAKQMRSWFK